MNYARVYDDFIADRLSKRIPSRAERHHIKPRSIGGSDLPDNLIYLSPADHFFAHLLLAKVHGGMLWVPVVMWCGGDKGNWRARKSRLNYEWASKAASRRVSGRSAWQFDPTVHSVCHADGREAAATQFDLFDTIGGVRSGINLLLKGKIKSYRGWRLKATLEEDVGRKGGNRHPMADQRLYTFVHTSGERFTGTRFDFCTEYGVARPNVCDLANGRRIISNGWMLEGSILPRVGKAHAAHHKLPLKNHASKKTTTQTTNAS